jgi:hypothetical protein
MQNDGLKLSRRTLVYLEGDKRWYRSVLDDPSLVDRAVLVPLWSGHAELAVPVGGKRRAGSISVCGDFRYTKRAVQLLEKLSGFPNVRAIRSPWREACHSVEWGEELPDLQTYLHQHDADCGALLGYSTSAIAQFLKRRCRHAS